MTGVVEVELAVECPSATFGVFLDAVYSGALPDLRDRVSELIHVLELVDKYRVEELRAACLQQLSSVGLRGAVAVLRAGLEKPAIVPETVAVKAIHAVLDDWPAIAGSREWTEFATAHPGGALFVNAFRARDK